MIDIGEIPIYNYIMMLGSKGILPQLMYNGFRFNKEFRN